MREIVEELRKLGSAFGLLWLGETVCGFGAVLMQFAMGVWVFKRSGSPQQYAFAFLSGTIPALLFMPWAGALADHFDRRAVLVVTDAIGAVLAIGLGALIVTDELQLPHLYAFGAIGAVLASIRAPSYQAAVTAVLPRHGLTRASGLSGLAQGILQLIGPVLAGRIIVGSGIGTIVGIQLSTMVVGVALVLMAFFRAPYARPRRRAGGRVLLRGVLNGFAPAVAFLRKEPLMRSLFSYVVIHDGLLVLASSMLTPLILSTHSSAVLGLVTSCGAAGSLAGSLMLVLMNTRHRLMAWSLLCNVCLALCVTAAGLYTSVGIWCACAFFALISGSISGGFGMTLWMRKTPESSRGSVFSLLGLSRLVTSSVVMLVGGVLGQQLLEPALASNGRWQHTVGAILGTGKGRGIGFLFVASGVACAFVSLAALARTGLRRLDVLVSDPPATVVEI